MMPAYPSYPGFGSNHQQGAQHHMVNVAGSRSMRPAQPNQPSRPGVGGVSTMPWNPGRFMQASQRPGPGRGQGGMARQGWQQAGPGRWIQSHRTGQSGMTHHEFMGPTPPGAQQGRGFDVGGLVGAEFNQQQALYDQNRQDMLGLAQGFQGQAQQGAMGFRQMADAEAQRGRQAADQFGRMASSPQARFGDEGVGRMEEAASDFGRFSDQQKDMTAERASSAMAGMQQQEQNQLRQMQDRFSSMGMGPEAQAMQRQELMAMGSMGRQQVLQQIATEERGLQSQLEQARASMRMQAGAAAAQNDQANAAFSAENQRAWSQMQQAAGQMAYNNWFQAQVQAAELEQQGFGSLAQVMQQHPRSQVSVIGSLLAAANLFQNTPIGNPDSAFTRSMTGGRA